MKIGAIAIVLGCLSTTASAEPAAIVASPERREKALSIGLWSLQGLAGLHGQYEAQERERWSWIAGGGFRFSARGDYGSSTLAAGAEARYWLKGRAVWARAAPRSMIGWYLGARIDLAWTRTTDEVSDRAIGNNLGAAMTATFGYRFVIRNRVELTPMIGAGYTQEIDLRGRLPVHGRPTIRLGLTVGWMYTPDQ